LISPWDAALTTTRSERERDTKEDRDREDRDRRENGANGDDRKRKCTPHRPASREAMSDPVIAIDSPERPAHDDLDIAE
jgi:hypothetical protein